MAMTFDWGVAFHHRAKLKPGSVLEGMATSLDMDTSGRLLSTVANRLFGQPSMIIDVRDEDHHAALDVLFAGEFWLVIV